jgi:hypothetical protein
MDYRRPRPGKYNASGCVTNDLVLVRALPGTDSPGPGTARGASRGDEDQNSLAGACVNQGKISTRRTRRITKNARRFIARTYRPDVTRFAPARRRSHVSLLRAFFTSFVLKPGDSRDVFGICIFPVRRSIMPRRDRMIPAGSFLLRQDVCMARSTYQARTAPIRIDRRHHEIPRYNSRRSTVGNRLVGPGPRQRPYPGFTPRRTGLHRPLARPSGTSRRGNRLWGLRIFSFRIRTV